MELIINNLFAVITTVLIPFCIWIFWLYIKRPKVSIEIIYEGGQSSPKAYKVYVAVPSEENVYDANESQREFELTFRTLIRLRNFSTKDALNPQLFFYYDSPHFNLREPLNINIPIDSKSLKDIKCEYRVYETKRGRDRSDTSILYKQISKDLNILLKYNDEIGLTYYSIYRNKRNKYRIIRPTRYNNNNHYKLPNGIYEK
ncbi:MAG: hypothetical protein LBF27_05725 [Sphingobacterium sp.]|nr:hypothetical protein [Sphingobacterium sp.]